ncbi:MAG: hypothetical protein ACR2MO_02470 [Acidimicrobiales bacterium]
MTMVAAMRSSQHDRLAVARGIPTRKHASRDCVPVASTGSVQRPPAFDASAVTSLQRSAGNAAVASLLALQRDEETEREKPLTFPDFKLTPPKLLGGAEPDWGLYAEFLRNRGLVLGDSESATIAEHWRRWLPLAQTLHGVPGVSYFKTTQDIMNSFTDSLITSATSRDRPNALEFFNQDDQKRYGVSTNTLTLKQWKF